MKNLIYSVFTLLIATVFLAIMPTEAEGAIYEDTVRLHIRANSDSEEDQALKLQLRDAILSEFGSELSLCESKSEAENRLTSILDEIEAFSEEFMRGKGYPYSVEARLCDEWFETRDYECFTLPKGYYTSLIINIGNGEGQNWWCVMYPPLCLDIATDDSGYTHGEELLITKKYSVKFKLLELISEIGR